MLLAAAGNEMLKKEALEVLYGDNTFHFKDPEVMKWWLKKTRFDNVHRLRHVTIRPTVEKRSEIKSEYVQVEDSLSEAKAQYAKAKKADSPQCEQLRDVVRK